MEGAEEFSPTGPAGKAKGEAQPKHWQPKNRDKAPKKKAGDEDEEEETKEGEEAQAEGGEEEKKEESESESESGDDELAETLKSSGFSVSLIHSQKKEIEGQEATGQTEEQVTTGEQAEGGKKKLTAYERRQMKKGIQPEQGGQGGQAAAKGGQQAGQKKAKVCIFRKQI
jgi:hypothetical protein